MTTPNSSVKDEEEDDENRDYQVDAIIERGPSPPENENSNSYEWSYEEQFKQVSNFNTLGILSQAKHTV